MLSELARNLQPEMGLFDSAWAYFLHDYDDIEDEKSSVHSDDETLSVDQSESLKSELSGTNIVQKTICDQASERVLKKSILDASLKRSAELLAHSRRLDPRQRNSTRDRSTVVKKGVVNNKVVKNKKYFSRSLDRQDSYARDSFRRTEELLAYSRRRNSGRKTLILEKPVKAYKQPLGYHVESRISNFRDNLDVDTVRDGPPGIIFIERDYLQKADSVSAEAKNIGSVTSSISRSRNRDDWDEKSHFYIDKGEQIQISSGSSERKVEDYNDILKRREMLRRISLLRIQTTKTNIDRDGF